jgi:uncharacterized membrane protein
MRIVLTVLPVLVTLLYPLAVWLGHGTVEPRLMAGLLILAALARALTARGRSARWWMLGAAVLAGAAIAGNAWMPLKLYPVLVNLLMLGVFGYSLLAPPSLIERFARLQEPELSPAAVQYTRRVTQVWCGFFVVNGTIAAGTALWATARTWFLYNGVIAYVLMGALFGGEYLVRLRFKRRHHD